MRGFLYKTTENCARRARFAVANSIESVVSIERLSKNNLFRQSQLGHLCQMSQLFIWFSVNAAPHDPQYLSTKPRREQALRGLVMQLYLLFSQSYASGAYRSCKRLRCAKRLVDSISDSSNSFSARSGNARVSAE